MNKMKKKKIYFFLEYDKNIYVYYIFNINIKHNI